MGEVVELNGEATMKGVKGTDKRKYLIDMMRTTAGNESEDKEAALFVPREELLLMFSNFVDDGSSSENLNLRKKLKIKKAKNEGKNLENRYDSKKLSSFLEDKMIPSLVAELTQADGAPTDSETLENLFHLNGVNMRYLGKVAQEVVRSTRYCRHMNDMIQRDIFVRSVKHYASQLLTNCQPHICALVAAHLLNCILAPSILLEMLNNDIIVLSKEH